MPKGVYPRPSAEQRFLAKIERSGECWLWMGARNRGGYGLHQDGRLRLAHRWAYEHFVGPIPPGLVLDHIVCDTPACVNPQHVAPRTHRQNILRGKGVAAENARKTRCKRDHELSGANLLVRADGARVCRECQRVAGRESKRRSRAANREAYNAYMREYHRRRRR